MTDAADNKLKHWSIYPVSHPTAKGFSVALTANSGTRIELIAHRVELSEVEAYAQQIADQLDQKTELERQALDLRVQLTEAVKEMDLATLRHMAAEAKRRQAVGALADDVLDMLRSNHD